MSRSTESEASSGERKAEPGRRLPSGIERTLKNADCRRQQVQRAAPRGKSVLSHVETRSGGAVDDIDRHGSERVQKSMMRLADLMGQGYRGPLSLGRS